MKLHTICLEAKIKVNFISSSSQIPPTRKAIQSMGVPSFYRHTLDWVFQNIISVQWSHMSATACQITVNLTVFFFNCLFRLTTKNAFKLCIIHWTYNSTKVLLIKLVDETDLINAEPIPITVCWTFHPPTEGTFKIIRSMGYCKKDVTPVLMHWSNIFLALTHGDAELMFAPAQNSQHSRSGSISPWLSLVVIHQMETWARLAADPAHTLHTSINSLIQHIRTHTSITSLIQHTHPHTSITYLIQHGPSNRFCCVSLYCASTVSSQWTFYPHILRLLSLG